MESTELTGAPAGALSVEPDLAAFVERVWRMGREHHRDLPWRYLDDPYAVLVSEVMLQQTQVARVLNYWPRFMDLLPSVDALAAADTQVVLELWQGLGYNRRALALKRCAEVCAREHAGKLPDSYEELLELPGIGPATAAGVMAFAYQKPASYLETNVRTVFLHELFPGREGVADKEIVPLVEATCSKEDPRAWYYALLDYGAHLKATLPNPSRRSRHHAKQGTFEGSRRQKRGELIRIVLAAPGITRAGLAEELDSFEREHGRGPVNEDLLASILADLAKEGFLKEEAGAYFCQ